MSVQQSIRQFLVSRSNEDPSSANEVTRNPVEEIMSIAHEVSDKMLRKCIKEMDNMMALFKDALRTVTEKVDKVKLEMEEKLKDAELSFEESKEETAKLKVEINELKRIVNQRQRESQSVVSEEIVVEDEDERVGQNQTVLPVSVPSDILLAIVKNHQRVDDEYWKSSLMITIGAGEFRDYRSWQHKLRTMGLHFMLEGVRSHYITGRGNLRLSFASEYECRQTLIRGRQFCKEVQIRNIHIEFLIPPRYVNTKKKMMEWGRQMKKDRVVSSYDVILKGAEPVLRTFHLSAGVKYLTLSELQQWTRDQDQEQELDNSDRNEWFGDDEVVYLNIFDPEQDLPPLLEEV